MIFWIAIAILVSAVTLAVTLPLVRASKGGHDAGASGLNVYKDQLKEIDLDRERGLLSDREAEAARAEVARRLIRAADTEAASKATGADLATPQPRYAYYAISALIPLAGLGLYLAAGVPGKRDEPYRERITANAETAKAGDLVAMVEARLREHPEDGKGWDVVAPVYMSLGRFGDAAEAFGNAARILGESAARLEGFATATIRNNDGVVTGPARKGLERAIALDPKRQHLRLWLALAKEQEGNTQDALKDYREILAAAPADAPWRKAVEARLAGLSAPSAPATAGQAAGPQTPGAQPSEAEAIAALPAEERQRTIVAMVEGLAARLKADGNNLQGWLRLVRAYKVLGRDADAREALSSAKTQFAKDEKSLGELDVLAKELGLAP